MHDRRQCIVLFCIAKRTLLGCRNNLGPESRPLELADIWELLGGRPHALTRASAAVVVVVAAFPHSNQIESHCLMACNEKESGTLGRREDAPVGPRSARNPSERAAESSRSGVRAAHV